MIAIVIMLILSSIIGGVINDHITFYGSPWSVKMQKKKAYLIVFVILWVGMSSIQMFQDAENDGTKHKMTTPIIPIWRMTLGGAMMTRKQIMMTRMRNMMIPKMRMGIR